MMNEQDSNYYETQLPFFEILGEVIKKRKEGMDAKFVEMGIDNALSHYYAWQSAKDKEAILYFANHPVETCKIINDHFYEGYSLYLK